MNYSKKSDILLALITDCMNITLPTSGRKKRFQEKLLDWYSEHSRELPWRNTHDPYHIVVSELMLQQTQVDRVIPKYDAWFKQFPTVKSLADAPTKDVIAAWQGLGYNRRALYLQRIAQTVLDEFNGAFPKTREELLELPGIGPYTAGALMSFAYKADEAIVDTNVIRLLGRMFIGYKDLPSVSEKELWNLSKSMIPKKGKTYYFNQALMDFGAMVCDLRKPKCDECPFQKMCASYPDIQDAKPNELRYQKKAKEKLYFGKPRRIWRGKILKYLHEVESATPLQIGYNIQHDFEQDRLDWVKEVIITLEKDGLISISDNQISVKE